MTFLSTVTVLDLKVPNNKELTNRRGLQDGAVRLRKMPTARAYMGTSRSRAKVDDLGEDDLRA